ncbi:cytochrome c oxidase subunit II [Bradyrhizobium sp. 182]|uniref:cytochrome c oxidase subunit II n=2 Tax=unclassified Bradyrhizobium TaxID=2631580 RepID=UPI001FF9F846|nr:MULTISPECIES: cytochrome c oxidase subunit II [unclassified Bradyrhizobium]MCK1597250.1 cytochrome c oxidase subunit II [Bradyrhizobium sp. 164]MCK1757536.1 cytochrome c oxidase subunit II [Bradyrhizobium sp. 137]MCK1424096.1 cytochrome c oxidase subunit II [Bradyrhizobium sp. CW12]MCK1530968.1 cytochrome c oxidase subunit II [Bradyrhizobium sp. 182]MCK1621639.1 cytochrome c oxidase subunit II [Bradyrhizobium sp. 159]
MPVRMRTALVPFATLPLAACAGRQSVLDPQGLQSSQILHTIFIFLTVAAAVWIAVVVVLGVSLLRRKRPADQPLALHQPFERTSGRVIFVLGLATLVVVLGLSIVSYAGQRTIFAKDENALTLKIIGHQWWWEVRYEADSPHRSFVTANEIRVPTGQPVKVELESADVIHSFWVPSLTGKMDLITGQKNELQFTAKNAGVYRGQCAEFCGLQHANMAFAVLALPPDEFGRWRDHENQSANSPTDQLGKQGEALFRARGCALCHNISGTLAGGQLGPDLTHIGSRTTIAAGTLPNTPATLAAWIADPQHIKPGNLMPKMPLQSGELIAILHYLEQLK